MSDDSTLLVSGFSEQGVPFAAITGINDISGGGISFFLNTPVCKDVILQLALCSRRINGLIFTIRATVKRVLEVESQAGRYLIGARFQGEFLQIGNSPRTEDIACELKQAVEHDERNRLVELSTISRRCDICGKVFVVPLEILRVSSPVFCFSCHQACLKFEMPVEETAPEKLS